MLTEHMKDAPPELQPLWQGSYARHIGGRFGARRVSLTQQTHLLPSMERVRDGGRLDDPESYEDQPLGGIPMRRRLNGVLRDSARLVHSVAREWDAFWHTPADPSLLGAMRIMTGLMLLYTHAVWGLELRRFFGPSGWLGRRGSCGPSRPINSPSRSGGASPRAGSGSPTPPR